MEFPSLGEHCSEVTCKQLDFLPMKCDACSRIFCRDHFPYEKHHCEAAYKKDVQVPVCPLCNTPVPVKRGETPDIKVGEHIDRECQSDPAKAKRKVYTNKCSVTGCKQKELVPVSCDKCRQNFCLRHRHETDHNCQGFQGTGRGVSSAGAAAMFRNISKATSKGSTSPSSKALQPSRPQPSRPTVAVPSAHSSRNTSAQAVQGNMSEDEAMARALQLSLTATPQSSQPAQQQRQDTNLQEEDDLALAQALAASEQEYSQQQRSKKSACVVN